MIVVRTPHRVSLFGGGTDFPAWYSEHGGAVIGGAIDKYCYLTVRELPPFFDHRYRVVYSQVETVERPEDIAHPAVRAAVLGSGIDYGLEVHHDSDLPARTGIGSSSAFVVGILHALAALRGEDPSADELARDAITLERVTLAETGGHQDQVLCAHGGFREVRFRESGSIDVSSSLDAANHLSSWLVLVYTGVKRRSSQISDAFVERLNSHENDRYLADLAAVTDQAATLLGPGRDLDMPELGRLLDETWTLKANMNPLAVPSEISDLHQRARLAGALGGKVSGAGGGGFCVFLVDPERQEAFARDMRPYLTVPFSFVDHGSEIIFHDRSTQSSSQEGLRRVVT